MSQHQRLGFVSSAVVLATGWVVADVVVGVNVLGFLGPALGLGLKWILLASAVGVGVFVGLQLDRRYRRGKKVVSA